MTKYARVDHNVVVEIVDVDQPIGTLFHADIAETFHLADTAVALGWSYAAGAFSAPDISLTVLRVAKMAEIATKADEILSAGAPVSGGLHVALDDGSRADLTALASTATAVLISNGAVVWPESYSRGWITIENTRVALPTATDGLTFAAAVGDYYSAIMQHRRDLKDAALAAENAAQLDAIDIAAGWPPSS